MGPMENSDLEEQAMQGILGDLDGVEGREVCQACGKPLDEEAPMNDEKEPMGKVEGVEVSIKPLASDEAKPLDLKDLKDEEPEHDDGMPLIL